MAYAIQNTKNINFDTNILTEVLKEIPAVQRQVFILKTFDEKPTKEICANFKINEKQFWTYIHNVRVKLMENIC